MKKIFLLLFLLPVAALLLTEICLYSQNTLSATNHWVATKRKLQVSMLGGAFPEARESLAGNILNLAVWGGYQEVVWQEAQNPSEVVFSFQLARESYLDFTYHRLTNGFSGIRLSNRTDLPSATWEGDGEGRFVAQQPLALPPLGTGWHEAKVQIQNGKTLLTIDRGTPIGFSARSSAGGRVGFRSGRLGARLRRVDALTPERRVHESFRYADHWMSTWLIHLAVLLAIALGFGYFQRSSFGFFAIVVLLSGVWYAFDFFYWSTISFVPHLPPPPLAQSLSPEHLEYVRARIFSLWSKAVGVGKASAESQNALNYPSQRIWDGPIYCDSLGACRVVASAGEAALLAQKKQGRRLLCIGNSQMLGVGASDLEHTYFVQLHRALSAALAPASLESINLAYSSKEAGEIVQIFRGQYLAFAPDLLVVDFSYEKNKSNIRESLLGLLEVASQHGIKTVMLDVPTSTEIGPGDEYRDPQMRMATQQLAVQYKIPLLALDGYFTMPEVQESGWVWWDWTHLTSYGQRLAAQWLVPHILPILR